MRSNFQRQVNKVKTNVPAKKRNFFYVSSNAIKPRVALTAIKSIVFGSQHIRTTLQLHKGMALQQTLPVPTAGCCSKNAIVIEDDNTLPYSNSAYSPSCTSSLRDRLLEALDDMPSSPTSTSFAYTPSSPSYIQWTPPGSPVSPVSTFNCTLTSLDQPAGDQPVSTCADKEQCDNIACVVCMDRKRNCFYTGCGHVFTCMDCALIMQDERPYVSCGEECDCESHVKYICPICRTISTLLCEAFI
jgi:hypothetical protein